MVVPFAALTSVNRLIRRESGQFKDQPVNYDRRTVFKKPSACDHWRERVKVIIITSTSQTSEIGEPSEQTDREKAAPGNER